VKNKIKLYAVPICLAIALLLTASASYAQTPQFVAAGSSAVFTETAIAGGTGDPITGSAARCGTHLWTSKTSSHNVAAAVDPRAGIPVEPGNIWVIWDAVPANTVCVFISVDSIVGLRMLFATAAGPAYATVSLNNNLGLLNNCNVALAGDNAIPYFTDDAGGLPTAICTIVQGATITSAFTDIRAEDGEFMNARASQFPGYPFGTAIKSAFTTDSAQVQDFYIAGNDPVDPAHPAVRATEAVSIGAQVVMHFLNTGTGGPFAAGDFGTLFAAGGNVNSHTLDLLYAPASNNLALNRTTDVNGSTAASQPINLAYREPTSGTYNTFEFQLPHEKGADGNQESAFPVGCAGFVQSGTAAFPVGGAPCVGRNPAYATAANGAQRARVIGTGQMVKVVNASKNAMGYAFWSFANFRNQPNVKYLTVDGIDPLGPSGGYTGVPPQCTGTVNPPSTLSCPALSLAGITTGNYRNWNVVRLVVVQTSVDAARNAFAKAFVSEIQDIDHALINDLVPLKFCSVPNLVTHTCTTTAAGLSVFRSHYALPSGAPFADPVAGPWLPGAPQVPSNGNPGVGPAESGGDVAGSIFNVQSDADFFADSGSTAEITGYIQ